MLKSMLVNKDFQTWHLIGWQHSRQPIRSHVRKALLTNMEFNMGFGLVTRSPGGYLKRSNIPKIVFLAISEIKNIVQARLRKNQLHQYIFLHSIFWKQCQNIRMYKMFGQYFRTFKTLVFVCHRCSKYWIDLNLIKRMFNWTATKSRYELIHYNDSGCNRLFMR